MTAAPTDIPPHVELGSTPQPATSVPPHMAENQVSSGGVPASRVSIPAVENAGPDRYPQQPGLPVQVAKQGPAVQTNPQFFVDQKRGELHELRLLLRQLPTERDVNRQREVVKKVIAYMTVGMDVSRLFSEMVMLSSTADMVQKKMVYLYVTNYAETNPSLSILAVNAFQKDCNDHDPRLRGLAIRSLCSLRVPEMVEYIEPALRRGLADNHPYVRRVCVMGLVKLWRLQADRELPQESAEGDESLYSHSGIVAALEKALYDPDPQVTVNAIHALNEVDAAAGGVLVTRELITALLNRIKQFNEWGQCTVLNLLVTYEPETNEERFDILNILDDRLKSSSAAVVLTLLDQALARLAPPLLTLVTTSCVELSYTVLQHILLILETAGGAGFVRVLEAEYQQFFCRYSDPSYVKSVKLEILTAITTEANVTQVLQELKECVSDADVSVGRKIIRCMGLIALQVPCSVNEVVDLVLSLLEHEVDFVMCASFAVIRDILRKHRQGGDWEESRIEKRDRFCVAYMAVFLSQVIDRVSDPLAKYGLKVSGGDLASALWIIGEFGASIPDAPYILEAVVERFTEEEPTVQLELLTACTKLFFARPGEVQPVLGSLLKQALNENVNFDVRDRALFVYRLIRANIDQAKTVFSTPLPPIDIVRTTASMDMSESLMDEFNTLAVMYRHPSSSFLCVEPIPFCGRSVRHEEPAPGRKALRQEPSAQPSLLDGGVLSKETASADKKGSSYDVYGGTGGAPLPGQRASEESDLLDLPTGIKERLRLHPREPLSSADFQRLWESASPVQRSVIIRQAPPAELFPEDVESAAAEANIFTMASGVLEGDIVKMFLYASDDIRAVFLCELMLFPQPPRLQLQVRTSPQHDPCRAFDFVDLLLGLLAKKNIVELVGES